MNNLCSNLTSTLVSKLPTASGYLRMNTSFNYDDTDDGIRLYIDAPSYLLNVDKGRSKGAKYPPVDAIRQWLVNKGVQLSDNELRGLAFIIARSISENGIAPTNVIAETIDDCYDDIIKTLTSYQKDKVKQSIKNIINDTNNR